MTVNPEEKKGMLSRHGKIELSRRRIGALLCLVLTAAVFLVMFWPLPCDRLIKPEHGDITFYAVEHTFSDRTTLPALSSRQWTVPKDSNVYSEILSVMGNYHYYRKPSGSAQDNHQPWISAYPENGRLIFSWKGTNDLNAEKICYGIYGRNSGQTMMNAIYDILKSQHDILP